MTAYSAAATSMHTAPKVAQFASSASRSELYARRPQPLLAGWRDAAERTLLGKANEQERDEWSIYLSSLSDEQEDPGRVCIHQEGCLVRHNGRRLDQHMRCKYMHYRHMHMHTGGHIYMAGTPRTTRRSCHPLSLHRGLSSFRSRPHRMSAATPRPRPWLPRLPCWRRPRLSLRPKCRPTGLHLDADLRCVAN